REAYQKVKGSIADGTFQFDGALKHQHEGSIGNLCHQQIKSKMQRILAQFNFEKVDRQIEQLI
ncbi:MAG: argininosuccinate lyase, partial [Bacteroidota bacterium]